MIVVDTNIIIYYFVQGDFTSAVSEVFAKESEWSAPYLWRSEFRNTAVLFLRKNLLTHSQVLQITQAAQKRMRDYEFHVATSDVYLLANASNCSAYDCEFVALAQELQVPLVTIDKKILREFPETAVSPQQFLIMDS